MDAHPAPAPAAPDPGSVSVVIPNLDGAHWLERCLPTLMGGTVRPAEVVVADDGSRDGSAEVTARFGATFLAGGGRTGFAATANRGIRRCRGEWVFLLNNDTEVDAGALDALLAAAARWPAADILAPLVRSSRDRVTIDSAGLLLYPDGVARPRWHGLPDPPAPPREEEVLLASGAAVLVRRALFPRAGLFDERFGSYLEDVDWGLRARRLGATAVFVPDALVYHHFSGTTGAFTATKARLVERNRILVAVRHLPLTTLLASPVRTVVRWAVLAGAPRGGDDGAAEPVTRMAAAVVRGVAEGLAAVPGAARERRRLRAAAVVPPARWRAMLSADRAKAGAFRVFGA